MAAILIVDDDDAVRDVLYDLFNEEHLCHAASSAEQALAFIREQPYDVVLTDISMPGLSGVELLGHLRQSQPDTPVIVITGINDRTHADGLMRLGARASTSKTGSTPAPLIAVEAELGATVMRRRPSGVAVCVTCASDDLKSVPQPTERTASTRGSRRSVSAMRPSGASVFSRSFNCL